MLAAALPFAMDPDHRLAVASRYGGIFNPNLYFFAWASLIMSYFIMMGCFARYHWEWCKRKHRTAGVRHFYSSFTMWCGVVMTSFVVMMSANRMIVEGTCRNDDKGISNQTGWPDAPTSEVCDRLKTASGLATISLMVSLAWSIVNVFLFSERNDRVAVVNTFVVAALLILWTYQATWLTFDEDKSPAADVCNLFFFTWASWALSLFMTTKNLRSSKLHRTKDSEILSAEEATAVCKIDVIRLEVRREIDDEAVATHDDQHAPTEESDTHV